MPELPEVNTFKNYFNEAALDQKIIDTAVHDAKIIRNKTGAEFAECMQGRTFLSSLRRGKYLFAELDNGHHVLFHFGMTGDLNYYSEDSDRSKHERFVFYFENGFRLGFDCPRKFARVLYLEDRDAYIEEIKLGEDALSIPQQAFLDKMEGKATTLKGFLLNQANLAGVGNLYADELCYRARIHPASRTNALSAQQKETVYQKLQEVLHEAVGHNPYYKDYPENWMWEWREEGQLGKDGVGTVQRTKVAGRTTYYCTDWQILYA